MQIKIKMSKRRVPLLKTVIHSQSSNIQYSRAGDYEQVPWQKNKAFTALWKKIPSVLSSPPPPPHNLQPTTYNLLLTLVPSLNNWNLPYPSQIFFTLLLSWSPWKKMMKTHLLTWSPVLGSSSGVSISACLKNTLPRQARHRRRSNEGTRSRAITPVTNLQVHSE